jgi:hypothetical protein
MDRDAASALRTGVRWLAAKLRVEPRADVEEVVIRVCEAADSDGDRSLIIDTIARYVDEQITAASADNARTLLRELELLQVASFPGWDAAIRELTLRVEGTADSAPSGG